jgi:DNA-binding NarL/FixJ family response regulator
VELTMLTRREREVLDLVAEGRTNAAIGHVLEVSPRTVAKHLEHAYRKLQVNCRVQAVARR